MSTKNYSNLLGMVKSVQDEPDLVNASPMKKFILSSHYGDIGNCVVAGSHISRQLATTATSICRRRFKPEDIILMVLLDEEEKGEAGIAFTETGIYHWIEDEEFVAEIPYESMQAVDYDEENVIVTTVDGKNIELFCGEDEEEKYSRYMYNFIMDIKEECEKDKDVEGTL